MNARRRIPSSSREAASLTRRIERHVRRHTQVLARSVGPLRALRSALARSVRGCPRRLRRVESTLAAMNLRASFGRAASDSCLVSVLGVGIALSVSACSRPSHVERAHVEPTKPLVASPALVSSGASDAQAPEAQKPFTSWTDPAAAERLLRGNAWPRQGEDALSCEFETPQQSCVPGSDAIRFGCVLECNRTCETSGKECTAKLDVCRATCAKDASRSSKEKHACELSCASETGRCLDRSVTTRDRCRTGECNAEVAAYEKRVSNNFGCKSKGSLVEICEKARTCMDDCKDDTCEANCLRKHAPGCDPGFQDAVKMRACQVFDTSI